MKVLVINCGSSSLKFQLMDMETESVEAKGLCERIGSEGSRIVYTPVKKPEFGKITIESPMPTHKEAIQIVIDCLTNAEHGVVGSLSEIDAVGHRVVHGGEKYVDSVLIDDSVIAAVQECAEFSPLHNPANIIGINVCRELMPGVPEVAVFDTAFHQTMPRKAFIYGLPMKAYTEYGIRRYGFHGTSHKFIARQTAQFIGRPAEELKIISCHLGNGASICAINGGKSVDTSMGLTPLAGLVMGTRSGDIDPAILEFYGRKEGLDVSQVTEVLNKKSGVFGISGGKSDFRDLEEGFYAGDPGCVDAIEIFCYNVAKTVGAYAAAMNGVDVITFTAGIGENSAFVRGKVCEYFGYLGIKIDEAANKERGEHVISTPDSKVTVCVIPTDEELMIARDTKALAEAQ
ncbi:MAG: acetate kinase [Lachnospiraceae bacterium]|nr:acetate kinase [Lachnospiraceae bacterium]